MLADEPLVSPGSFDRPLVLGAVCRRAMHAVLLGEVPTAIAFLAPDETVASERKLVPSRPYFLSIYKAMVASHWESRMCDG